MNTIQLSDDMKRRLLEGEFINGKLGYLQVRVEKIIPRRGVPHEAEIVVNISDGKGIALAELCRLTVTEGGSLIVDGLHRAFDIRIS